MHGARGGAPTTKTNEKQPGENPEGKYHFNPGNMAGKEPGDAEQMPKTVASRITKKNPPVSGHRQAASAGPKSANCSRKTHRLLHGLPVLAWQGERWRRELKHPASAPLVAAQPMQAAS